MEVELDSYFEQLEIDITKMLNVKWLKFGRNVPQTLPNDSSF